MNKLVLPVTFLSVLLLAGCGNQSAKSSASSQKDTSSKVVSSKKASSSVSQVSQSTSSSSSASSSDTESSSSSTAQTASDSSINVVQQYVRGQMFTIMPELYDGIPVNKAMDEQKAPQNIVHDYTVSIRFDTASTATVKFIGEIRPEHKNYTISNNTIKVDKYTIPYSVSGNSVTFLPWKASDGQGGTITYKFSNQ